MYPELFKIGSIQLYSYGLLIMLGLLLGYWYAVRQLKTFGLSQDKVSELFLWCAAAVFLGGKFFFWLEEPSKYIQHPGELFSSPGQGFVFYGSFLFTVVVLFWWFRKNGLQFWQMMDIVGVSGALVHGFGKIGCLMAGCCFGKVCNNGWGVVFSNPHSHAEPLNKPLYPTQLWDAAIIFGIVALMLLWKKRKAFNGQLFLFYGLFYAIGRFFTEKYRGDEARGFLFNGLLSHSQFIALCIILVCVIIYLYLRKKEKKSAV